MSPTDVPLVWSPPGESQLRAVNRVLAPWRTLTKPLFLGKEKVPKERPVLFIANHTLMGMLDTPLLLLGIYEETGHFPRSMGDHFHFKVPIWRSLLRDFGVVHGTRENCRKVMDQGHSLIVFPGGGREVFKRRGESYQLLWGKRAGFARLAIERGYPIIPVAAVGAEECYSILFDQNDLFRLPGGASFLGKSPRRDVAFPTIPKGLGSRSSQNLRGSIFSSGISSRASPIRIARIEMRRALRFVRRSERHWKQCSRGSSLTERRILRGSS